MVLLTRLFNARRQALSESRVSALTTDSKVDILGRLLDEADGYMGV